MQEIRPNLFRCKIPLPDSPLKYLNSYIIKTDDRNLIIDTGFNRKECLEAMQKGLQELDIDLHKTDFFITHLHADHFGLVTKLVTETSRLYFNRPEMELIETWEGFEPMIAFAGKNGFPRDDLRAALAAHPGNKFGSKWVPELEALADGDTIKIGTYAFQCIETPGHTLGHTCLYEPSEKILIAGDHILTDITPNIQCWSDNENPLQNYLKSLDKVYALDVEMVLPGHRRLIDNHRKRIDELKNHHFCRLDEVCKILESGSPKHAFRIASEMTWEIRCNSWDEFPIAQKWFATGEAIAHLNYLENSGRISRTDAAETIQYIL
jgi:glyoxylase-like metal-dependent hydrolase (beta-lactamase superfamily II)